MMRSPEAGSVKTRLVPPLTCFEASALYEAFLSDIFCKLKRLRGADLFAAYTPSRSRQRVASFVPPGVGCFPQAGTNLGMRMQNAFESLFGLGYKSVVMIGSDSPDMPLARVKEAFAALDGKCDAVFGPALDGGYYLVGLKKPTRLPFDNIPWSTATVLSETLKRIKGSLSFKLLKPWHDIDTFDDIRLLRKRSAPRTFEFALKAGFLKG